MEHRHAAASRGLAALAVLGALLAGCAPGVRRVNTPDAAFIYGFFEVPEKVGSANCVGIIQDEKVGIAGRAGCMRTSPEGLFFIEDVPPIRHNIHAFYVDNTHNSLGSMAKPFAVKPGELRLWGIFRYQVVSKPFLVGQGKFSLTPGGPSHAEVLRKLLQQESISAKWRRRIQARLKELGG